MTKPVDHDATEQPTPDEQEKPQFVPPYRGHIVYVERATPDTAHSNYHDGSYLVIEETSGELFGVGLRKINAYELHEPTSLPLVGAAAYRVLAVDPPTPDLVAILDTAIAEAHGVLTGTRKGQWVESVYERAFVRAVQARHLIADQLGLPPNPDEPTFVKPAQAPIAKPVGTTTEGSAAIVTTGDPATSTLLEPLVDLLKPLTLAGASAELHVVFPPATSAEQKAASDRAAARRRIGEQIIATSKAAQAQAEIGG
jgi:hypothetical protein